MTEHLTLRRNPNRQPTHPGEHLREDILPAANLDVTAVAKALGVSRQTIHNILSEKAAVTPEMAVRLGKLFGNGPKIWLRMQENLDLWKAQNKLAAALESIKTLNAA